MSKREVVISRFILGGRNFYFHTIWQGEEFSITITDGKYAWQGHATSSYVETTLKPKGMPVDDYLNLTKEALRKQDTGKKKFDVAVQQGGNANEVKLIWNIKLDTGFSDINGLSMKGTLLLTRVENARAIIQANLEYLISRVTHCEEENTELKRMNKSLTLQRNDALSQFDQLTIEKQCMQTEMFSKFVEVLNEKKKKIRQLKENLKNNPRGVQSPTFEDEEDYEGTLSQAQTGESQISPLFATLSIGSISGPTPSMDLLKDDGSDDIFQPAVRKRFRGSTPSDNESSTAANTKSSLSFAAPTLNPSLSHGIITLPPNSPYARPKTSKRKVRVMSGSDSESSPSSVLKHKSKKPRLDLGDDTDSEEKPKYNKTLSHHAGKKRKKFRQEEYRPKPPLPHEAQRRG
eukprot:TRINITY_DN5384_c0_g1_i1.p1 TRINITY_DN5384_c0_g1~~TRINITY_DN5384_c0_g1_i1.p1  ORF type:complete len:404 (+),score=75.71 TRINITY_DN5384_c0_g1_i1:49-1260(+)